MEGKSKKIVIDLQVEMLKCLDLTRNASKMTGQTPENFSSFPRSGKSYHEAFIYFKVK